ncbi:NIF3-like protein 1 [Watersipora subatra]|uniref:NIF3-like protein 1 n=1 Tax=Watersipora subatra TaxID=2589382 RepID=UPI00355B2B53
MSKFKGVNLNEVVKKLESIAPLRLAESWDNVGLLVEPSPPHVVQKLMLTNDLTQPVLTEAVQKKCNMIFSYHPPIFQAMKRLTQVDFKQKMIVQCLENRMAVFSPHTSHDVAEDGVNDWLLAAFGDVSDKHSVTKCEDIVCVEKSLLSESDQICLESAAGVDIKSSFGPFCYIPRQASLSLTPEAVTTIGCGRKALLKSPLTISQIVDLAKKHLKLPHIRVALGDGKTLGDNVKSVACCAGSGASVLRNCDAELYLTGEMSHHEVLHATSHGRSVILCEHSNTERGYLSCLQEKLTALLPSVEFVLSQLDADPLIII